MTSDEMSPSDSESKTVSAMTVRDIILPCFTNWFYITLLKRWLNQGNISKTVYSNGSIINHLDHVDGSDGACIVLARVQ